MVAVSQRHFDCLSCHEQIRLAKLENTPVGQRKRWEKYELDGKTLHRCRRKEKKEEEEEEGGEPNNQLTLNNPQATATATTPAKEIASIKAQLLVLVTRLDQLEKREGKEATRK